MNKKRRQDLRDALEHLEKAADLVSDAGMDEQMAHDNLPDSFQYSERGERMEEVVSNLESAGDLISEAIELVNMSLE